MAFDVDLNKQTSLNNTFQLRPDVQEYFQQHKLLPSIENGIHEPFKQFLQKDKQVTFEYALDDIYKNLMPHLIYSKSKKMLSNQIDLQGNLVTFHNYFDYGFSDPTGVCDELAHKLLMLILKKYPDINVMIMQGQDNKFFSVNGARHAFIVAFSKVKDKTVFMDYYKNTLPSNDINIQPEGEVYLLDPSYGDIKPFLQSGYVIKSGVTLQLNKNKNKSFESPSNNKCISTPVMMDKKTGDLLSLVIAEVDMDRKIGFMRQDQQSPIDPQFFLRRDPESVVELFSDPDVCEFVRKFAKKDIQSLQ